MYVVFLDAPAAVDAAVVGGKGYNLMRLVRAGFRVPAGFVVTTRAFADAIRGSLAGRDTPAAMRERIEQVALPRALLREIEVAYADLLRRGWDDLVVRSSAVDEDSLDQSWAGQQDSYVHVQGFAALLDHVRRCWASVFTEHALSYHSRDGFASREPAMAVVVQGMVHADIAGVTFTVNPVSGRRDEVVHTSSYGLGETVVNGGDADVFVVGKADGDVREQTIGAKSRMRVAGDTCGSTMEAEVPADKASASSLGPAWLRTLTDLARGVEAAFGEAQDIEWAIRGDELHVLQARPITAAKGLREPTRPEDGAVWTNANVGEALPGVGTPFTWSVIGRFARLGFEHALGTLGLPVPTVPMVRNLYGRVYLNQSALLEVLSRVPFLAPERLLAAAGGSPMGRSIQRQSPWPFLVRLPLTLPRLAGSQIYVPVKSALWRRRVRGLVQRVEREVARHPGKRALADLLEGFTDEVFNPTGTLMLSAASNALASYILIGLLIGLFSGGELSGVETRLFSGLTRLKSAQPGFALLRLARIVKNQGALLRLFRGLDSSMDVVARIESDPAFEDFYREFRRFLEQHGYRAPLEAEVATPRWGDRPDTVVDILRSYLQAGEPSDPIDLMKARVRDRRRAEEQVKRRVGPLGRLLLAPLLPYARDASRLREELRNLVVKTISVYRTLGLDVGRHLVADSLAGRPDDAFFLTLDEWQAYLRGRLDADLSARIALRKGQFAIFSRMPDPPPTFLQVGSEVVVERLDAEPDSHRLRGLAGSPGRVTGRARVLASFDEIGRLGYGDVLVTRQTDVGWTPLFLVAGAVVTEMGGPLSHSSVVAREYGKPAVLSVAGATTRIADGAVVTVDGDAGFVWLHEADGPSEA